MPFLLNINHSTAITIPSCEPLCGQNAHCQYGLISNECVCNAGLTGNPYEVCGAQKKMTCSQSECGVNADCRQGPESIECVCAMGYVGNPFVQCNDIDECSIKSCGNGAVCINTPGSYDCKCRPGFAGNPFALCSPLQNNSCDDPFACECGTNTHCPIGFECNSGRCRDLCGEIACGPRAACDSGKCVCPPGYIGNANDAEKGCYIRGQCNIDQDCKKSEICFQLGRGLRKCVDACSKFQCGPNALCISNNHQSTCICAEGYTGNPADFHLGCQSEQRVVTPEDCTSNSNCANGQVCIVDGTGRRACGNPCATVACGTNEQCQLDVNSNPICNCKDTFIWNPVLSVCEKPSIPDCTTDSDCHPDAACRPDSIGIKRCMSICDEFQCPANSACISIQHKGSCQCLPGYAGNPKDRNGCRIERQDQCLTSAECQESEICLRDINSGVLTCKQACDNVKCGPQAICVTNNHVAQCQCPPGPYDGDPYDIKAGCKSVPCVYNIDCPTTQLCNRLTHMCYNVCNEDSCGENAICIAENNRAICQCPPGYKGDPIPEYGCTTSISCDHCADTATCEIGPNGAVCKCPPGLTGLPETTGCHPIGTCPNGDSDCPSTAICVSGRCVDKCDNACGPNMVCKFENSNAVCMCPYKFLFVSNEAKDGCIRETSICTTDIDCNGGVCYRGQCSVACRNENDCAQNEHCLNSICIVQCTSHSQCPSNQACTSGTCSLGCRSNKDCTSSEVCYNNKCQNPCQTAGVCGPNALCKFENHITACECPAGFEGNPTPELGCVRVPATCVATKNCPAGHMCIANQCNVPCKDNLNCAIGERCSNGICAKVCYTNNNCLPGEICNERGTCQSGCSSDVDCPTTQICANGKCKCGLGFIGTPFGCVDIDECTDYPCHRTAQCQNIPGSFKCVCPEQTVGDAYAEPGCTPSHQCKSNTDCDDDLTCAQGKCIEPCALRECGRHAQCVSINRQASCQCPSGHLGDAMDKAIGCFKVECTTNEDCPLDRQCQSDTYKCTSKLFTLLSPVMRLI